MEYCGYVVKVDKMRPHSNADRLQVAEFYGNETCVSTEVARGDIGIYFPSDLQLSEEFCEVNHMCRKKKDGTPDTGYLEESRHIRAIRLRGERSDGIFCSLNCLEYTGVNMDDLKVGMKIDTVNGHEICCKYIPVRQHKSGHYSSGNKTRKKVIPVAPLFAEHADTEQLAYNLGAFKSGDELEITLKMHGTSGRTAHLPVLKGYSDSWMCKFLNHFRKEPKHNGAPIYEYDYVSGTRRCVLDTFKGGWYGSNKFREKWHEFFKDKLQKGEEIFYEIVGFTDTGVPIMPSASNSKLNDKEFVKQYGWETVFSYGCDPYPHTFIGYNDSRLGYQDVEVEVTIPQNDIYVYRMTMTNEDGFTVEYTPDFMRYRCEQMGVKTVPVFAKVYVRDDGVVAHNTDGTYSGGRNPKGWTIGDAVKKIAEEHYDGPDPIGKTHVREGVVVRIVNRPKFTAYKHKNFLFKQISGIAVAEVEASGTIEEMSGDMIKEM